MKRSNSDTSLSDSRTTPTVLQAIPVATVTTPTAAPIAAAVSAASTPQRPQPSSGHFFSAFIPLSESFAVMPSTNPPSLNSSATINHLQLQSSTSMPAPQNLHQHSHHSHALAQPQQQQQQTQHHSSSLSLSETINTLLPALSNSGSWLTSFLGFGTDDHSTNNTNNNNGGAGNHVTTAATTTTTTTSSAAELATESMPMSLAASGAFHVSDLSSTSSSSSKKRKLG
jgi:hypothetical protein